MDNSFFPRIRKALQIIRNVQEPPDVAIGNAVANMTLPTVEKSSKSKLDVRSTDTDKLYVPFYSALRTFYNRSEEMPEFGNPDRDVWLDKLWHEEPIMAGAVYSMAAKMTALSWSVTGKRRRATKFAEMLSGAAFIGGYSWNGFISSTANDFYTLNRGAFWETPRYGSYKYGSIADIGHIDALSCMLTGNTKYPMHYTSALTGQTLRFREGEFVHFSSLPSPREEYVGAGYCAVDRAIRALKILILLHDYDEEKLSNLPPEGIAAIWGLTKTEFEDSLDLWKFKREADASLTYPQVLWLLGTQPDTKVGVDLVGFSQIPESFDRKEVVTQYVSTLALVMGVDAREFWPISSGALGTASESEIQHMKAKGKGPGEFISIVERNINAELDDKTEFAFDTQDIEEDQNAALVAKSWIEAYLPISELAGVQGGLTADDFLRLLADKGVLPDYMVHDDRIAIMDSDVALSRGKSWDADPEGYTKIVYKDGVLSEERLPPIVVSSRDVKPKRQVQEEQQDDTTIVDAYLAIKQIEDNALEDSRNITGNPIPEKEVTRGSRITKRSIQTELERWQEHPVLSQYVEEAERVLETVA